MLTTSTLRLAIHKMTKTLNESKSFQLFSFYFVHRLYTTVNLSQAFFSDRTDHSGM